MCRLAAYLGPVLSLESFLEAPSHSLIKQSWAPAEMDEAVLNADGFGLGWFTDDRSIATYRNTQPIWSDINLKGLNKSLSSHLWVANVRSATPGQVTSLGNTQPFEDERYLFLHNGFIENFNTKIRQKFHLFLDPEIQSTIMGSTDSEFIFALIRYINRESGTSMEKTLLELDKILRGFIDGPEKVLLNIIITDGNKIYTLKHAINGMCPSLYYNLDDSLFPGAVIIASECLTDSPNWQAADDHSVITFSPGRDPEIITL